MGLAALSLWSSETSRSSLHLTSVTITSTALCLRSTIPASLGNLTKLESLNLRFNQLTGSVPDVIFNISLLRVIDLSSNDLYGSLPVDVCSHYVPKLERIYLPFNRFEGRIPSNLYKCKELQYLSLAFNEFTGSIPIEIGNLTRFKYLYLGYNNLEDEAFKSFDVECGVLHNIRHRNLTKIVSSCSNADFIALVLEYMPNGSLEKWLYSHNYCLTLLERLNIMIDVATALEYLHHGQTTLILHCDLKPINVLLDKDLIAHVCDFGIAKLLGEDEFMAQTKNLATIGYMAPEYGREEIVSTKGDVYSYGIMLMETFTRKKPTDEMFSDILTMRSWVYEASLSPIVQVVDAHLIGRGDEDFLAKKECASSILHLALDCLTNIPTQRINMEDVVVRLNKIKIIFLRNTRKVS
ncbi:hypothetical protein LguiA_004638 [Lonicera macranthoides]